HDKPGILRRHGRLRRRPHRRRSDDTARPHLVLTDSLTNPGVFDMTIPTAIGYVLAGLLAAGIIFIGARFLVAPRVAAAGYGVPADHDQPSADAYLSVKRL